MAAIAMPPGRWTCQAAIAAVSSGKLVPEGIEGRVAYKGTLGGRRSFS